MAYATTGACDAEFMAVVEYWALEGFEFNRSVEVSVPPFGVSGVTEEWADRVLDFVVIPAKRR